MYRQLELTENVECGSTFSADASRRYSWNATIFENGHGIAKDRDKRGFSGKFAFLNGERWGTGILEGPKW